MRALKLALALYSGIWLVALFEDALMCVLMWAGEVYERRWEW